jgi:hypothetical protein
MEFPLSPLVGPKVVWLEMLPSLAHPRSPYRAPLVPRSNGKRQCIVQGVGALAATFFCLPPMAMALGFLATMPMLSRVAASSPKRTKKPTGRGPKRAPPPSMFEMPVLTIKEGVVCHVFDEKPERYRFRPSSHVGQIGCFFLSLSVFCYVASIFIWPVHHL